MAAKKKSPAKKAPAKKSPAKKVSASRPKSQTDEPGKGRGIGAMRGSGRGGRGGSTSNSSSAKSTYRSGMSELRKQIKEGKQEPNYRLYQKNADMAQKYFLKGDLKKSLGKGKSASKAYDKGNQYAKRHTG